MIVHYMRKRRGYWYYVRRVPREVQAHEAHPFIVRSTKIRVGDDPRGVVARIRVQEFWWPGSIPTSGTGISAI